MKHFRSPSDMSNESPAITRHHPSTGRNHRNQHRYPHFKPLINDPLPLALTETEQALKQFLLKFNPTNCGIPIGSQLDQLVREMVQKVPASISKNDTEQEQIKLLLYSYLKSRGFSTGVAQLASAYLIIYQAGGNVLFDDNSFFDLQQMEAEARFYRTHLNTTCKGRVAVYVIFDYNGRVEIANEQ